MEYTIPFIKRREEQFEPMDLSTRNLQQIVAGLSYIQTHPLDLTIQSTVGPLDTQTYSLDLGMVRQNQSETLLTSLSSHSSRASI